MVFPISMDAVVLSPPELVGPAAPLVVLLALLFVVAVVPAGGWAVEEHPASTNAATAGARASAASLDECSVMWARIDPRFLGRSSSGPLSRVPAGAGSSCPVRGRGPRGSANRRGRTPSGRSRRR